MTSGSCSCAPGRPQTSLPTAAQSNTSASAPLRALLMDAMRPIPGGFLDMGAARSRYAADLDSPRRRIRLDPFHMMATTVTNRVFAQFIGESGHRTTAEVEGWSFVFHMALPDPQRHPLHPPGTSWWRQVAGADWAHPEGPGSDVSDRMDHPVVHVSWHDAMAFARFTGTSLPSEAQWEWAARGGLRHMKFPWGNDPTPKGQHRHNIWQGQFPHHNSAEDGHIGTAPAGSYPPNGFSLHNMTGNVWEWVADWFGPLPSPGHPLPHNPSGPTQGQARVMRGGSHLCHDSYCSRYFVHSRSHNTPDSSTGHIGFRLALSGADQPLPGLRAETP